jgi:hypothetical protein
VKIRLSLPVDPGTEVQVNSKPPVEEVLISPSFVKGMKVKTVAYLDVEGKAGNVRSFILSVNASDGRLLLQPLKPVDPGFDSAPPGAEDEPEPPESQENATDVGN